MNKTITVEVVVNNSIEKVWEAWNNPEHITKWAFASDTWEAPHAENDLKVGGRFMTRMQEKNPSTDSTGSPQAGSGQGAGFDFAGTYTEVVPHEKVAYVMDGDDHRNVVTTFEPLGDHQVKIVTTFEMENENPEEMQRQGWQGILNNFKKHAEAIN